MFYTAHDREIAIDLYYERMHTLRVTTDLTDTASGETLYVVSESGAPYRIWKRDSGATYECDCVGLRERPCAHVGAVLLYRASQIALNDMRTNALERQLRRTLSQWVQHTS